MPEPVTLVGEMTVQVRPAGTVSVRLTTPANPLTAVTVIVEVALVPTDGSPAGEVEAIVKSWTVNVAVVVCVMGGVVLVPVMVTV